MNDGELVYNNQGMCLGHWCEFCQMAHSSISCFHPGRVKLAEAQAEIKRLKKLVGVVASDSPESEETQE